MASDMATDGAVEGALPGGAGETFTYDIYIRASPEEIWDAITNPESSARYGYQGPMEYDLRPGGAFRGQPSEGMKSMGMTGEVLDGEVLEVDRPRRLVQTYRFLFDENSRAEGFTRVTWELEPSHAAFTRLVVRHDLDGAPGMAGAIAAPFSEQGTGGWSWILSDLKSLLETGRPMA